jgi:hypothetical protein
MNMTTTTTTRKTYKVTMIQGSSRIATGSDGETYISHKMPSGKWSRWTTAHIVPV